MTPFVKLKLRLAWQGLRTNDLVAATGEINEAIEAEGRHPPLVALLAEIARREGRLRDASVLAREVLDEFGPDEVASGVLGKIALEGGKPNDALPHLQDAFRLRPSAYSAELVVDALDRLKRTEEARQILREAIERFPGQIRLLRRAVIFHQRHDDREEARRHVEKILEIDPDNDWAKRKQIEIKSAGRSPEAVGSLLGIGDRGRDPHMRGLYAKKLKESGDMEGAAREFAEAAKLDPRTPYWRKQTGFAFARARRDDEAISFLRPLFIEEPQDQYVRNALFAALKRTSGRESIVEAIDEALARNPDKGFLHGLRKKHGS